MNRQSPRCRHLTVIELLCILVILAVLAGMMLPALNQSREKARRSSGAVDLLAACERVTHNTEEYDHYADNPFRQVRVHPLSTFSIDVDTAAYTNLRRFVSAGQLPPKDAVRIEEMINYFDYAYPEPTDEHPCSLTIEQSRCPWNGEHLLARIGLRGKARVAQETAPSNLVFLLDVSGSMQPANKLPLVRQAMKMMVQHLAANDRVAIVTYAGGAGLVLRSTPATETKTILRAIAGLHAGGSTAGSAGIELAYEIAAENFIEGGNNRVILATDGDFNVGVSSSSELVRLIEKKRQQRVYLTICGFGMGNYKDGRLEQISNAGNGNYFYIDSPAEAEKVFVTDLGANLYAIANDVKIQVEFNPLAVQSYRLIGYENRVMAAEDFNDDRKDAGEMGPGHTVTALYELVPAGAPAAGRAPDALRYQAVQPSPAAAAGNEMMTVKVRYKLPDADESHLITRRVARDDRPFISATSDFRFASAVAAFGMALRESPERGALPVAKVIAIAASAVDGERQPERLEFVGLARHCAALMRTSAN